jgi:hypothetical protein
MHTFTIPIACRWRVRTSDRRHLLCPVRTYSTLDQAAADRPQCGGQARRSGRSNGRRDHAAHGQGGIQRRREDRAWPIFFIGDDEIVAGRSNKHLDFRLSVLKAIDGDAMSVVVSTICTVHNVFGKIYLFFIIPFHWNGVQSLMSNAVVAKRL